MGHILVAPDKFKGSATAAEAARHLAAGVRDAGRHAVELPVADGGEGTLDAAVAAGFRPVPATVSGPTGAPVRTGVAIRHGTAVVELAAASGLAHLTDGPAPLRATSRGTGELVAAALDAGATTVVLGVGGSACTDGGAGMLSALGARLLDADGAALPDGGAALAHLHRVDLSGLDRRLAATRFVLASDVDNPLLGPTGAAAVYGPQKGADAGAVAVLEAALARWAALLGADAAAPGAGAAGGVGFAALAVLGARPRPGIDVVLDLVGFREQLTGAELVITGEGALDEQTLRGKAPVGVAAAARSAGVAVAVVCGRSAITPGRAAAAGLGPVHVLGDVEPDLARCLADPGPPLRALGRRIAAA
ncbi:glycerate kinase [Pseudonocardia petroleophila]|uniref:Glycerate kinase n=2 Tax=Pseudonocardia petroleophila TaxID=37331 RepID=A0A7G7MEY2_9PSEU|nr:glycerate kinase [Pseudonocardia petroleophila]QNG51343.1 glycerate kinase [Pseudonocardia petroleophila]